MTKLREEWDELGVTRSSDCGATWVKLNHSPRVESLWVWRRHCVHGDYEAIEHYQGPRGSLPVCPWRQQHRSDFAARAGVVGWESWATNSSAMRWSPELGAGGADLRH